MNKHKDLLKLLNNSYAPYSNFNVAAIAIDKNKKEYKGVNVENASFGATSCAERNAIFSAISENMKIGDLKEIHLIARNDKNIDKKYFALPCGICRQIISEASNNNAIIYLYNLSGDVKKYSIKDLLPYSFQKEVLLGKS